MNTLIKNEHLVLLLKKIWTMFVVFNLSFEANSKFNNLLDKVLYSKFREKYGTKNNK